MNAELYGSSHPSEAENATPVSFDEASSGGASRAEMENSVLDALRPLLRPKRKKGRDGRGTGQQGGSRMTETAQAGSSSTGDEENDLSYDEPQGREAVSHESDSGFEDEFETFTAIGEDLERRSRQSATMVRLLEQHRQQLMTAERERDAAYDKLARVVPVVQETAQELRDAMNARKIDDDPTRMHRLFMLNGRALDELEKVATTLFADYLWVKSAWEQYARSVEDARKLRATLES